MPLSRRSFLAGTAAAAATLVMPAPICAFSRGRRALARRGTFTPLRRGVGIFEERGGTIGWLATPDALVMVDSQYPDTAAGCREGLRDRSDRGLDRLINTHHHGDHTGGNPALAVEATHIVAHRNVPALQRAAAARRPDSPEPAVADVTFEERWEEDLGDETIRLYHFGPAHTGGDAVVQFEKADVVHMGDLIFNRRPPFIDVAGGASAPGWIDVLERTAATFTDETLFIFGHSGEGFEITGSHADLLVQRDFLTALVELVQKGIADGRSEDQLAALTQIPGFPDHFMADRPTGVPNAIRAVFTELSGDS